jgi:acetyl esterase/lipase
MPDPYTTGDVDPETASFNHELEDTLARLPHITTQPVEAVRRAREEGTSVFGPITPSLDAAWRKIPGPAGEVPVRVFAPDSARGVYLHIHGGGFAVGSAVHHDTRLEAIVRECGMAVVSVEYRLAPEHPYPAGPDDCEATAVWLAENALTEFGSDLLVIGGESAGANLAAVTLTRMRDRHGFSDVAGANLVYGAYDLRMTPSAARWGHRPLIIDTPTMQWYTGMYLGRPADADPDTSPLFADLGGFPPALFTVGTVDPLLDDTLFMYERWLAAGNEAELAVYPGGVHAFDAFDTPVARRATSRIHHWLTAVVEAAAGTPPPLP